VYIGCAGFQPSFCFIVLFFLFLPNFLSKCSFYGAKKTEMIIKNAKIRGQEKNNKERKKNNNVISRAIGVTTSRRRKKEEEPKKKLQFQKE
jgi:predicted kinase